MQMDMRSGKVQITVADEEIATSQAYDIVSRITPQFFDLFLEKNRKYRKVGNALGSRGVFPDIHRKVGILKDRIWDAQESPGEPTREVAMDLIGHLFLMIYLMDLEEKEQNEGMAEAYLGDRLARGAKRETERRQQGGKWMGGAFGQGSVTTNTDPERDGPNYPSGDDA